LKRTGKDHYLGMFSQLAHACLLVFVLGGEQSISTLKNIANFEE
jgi:hypothetical protein